MTVGAPASNGSAPNRAEVSDTGTATRHPELSGAEIARHVGRERSQISRMLKALSAHGLVEQNPETRGYRLGWQLHVLAAHAGDQRLLGSGTAVLRAVVAETGESALLSILQGDQSFTILRERSPHTVQAGGWVGRTSPLHVTASGRALILDHEDDDIRALLSRTPPGEFGPRALRSVAEVLERLHHERQESCTVAIDELEGGLLSVGAPVRDATGRIIASLNVSAPTSRALDRLTELSATTKVAARRLSAIMSRAS
ncbi:MULTISPECIES: IclR family transcriptional regulator [unclassified Amycolatopsis]|uniref:IclR family transcriptional regulator n=1 Tax=unclassified Amycolatopsis TaxID=2618356 RepID=UPI001C69EEBD|nr:IclR family transcriptional regulator [Amycolatopsis sp. DSM 110486]QYN19404.1 IclR family transcriptional regulator [Amycolatopsis sp. DSM 110486]